MKRGLVALVLGAVAYLLLVLVYIPRQVVHADRFPITRSPEELGLAYEDVVLAPADEDIRLKAWWMPAASPEATLIFVHGGASNRHTPFFRALEFYAEMVKRGVSVLALDLRNHGASDAASTGLRFGLAEKEDLEAAITWATVASAQTPLVAMGISMGGAVAIYAASEDDRLDGLILVDPLLDTVSAFENGVEAATGLDAAWLGPAAWSAVELFGLPGEGVRPLDVGKSLTLPILLIQDPSDPVTVATHALELAGANRAVELWLAPALDAGHAELAWRGGWGAHVSAFAASPEPTLEQIMAFLARVRGR